MEAAAFHDIDIATMYGDLSEQRGLPARPYVVLHMVSSADGKASASGRVRHLGSKIDRSILRQVRGYCDAVAYGAGTLRAESVDPSAPEEMLDWRRSAGMREHPLRVVFSNAGDVPMENRFFRMAGDQPVVFTAQETSEEVLAALRPNVSVHIVGSTEVDLPAAMRVLRTQLAVRRLVVEGGPTLNYSLFKAGLVDELFLTVAPRIIGGHLANTIVEGREFAAASMPPLRLSSVHRHENELFLRYAVLSV